MTDAIRMLLALALIFVFATDAQAQSETLLTDVTVVDVIERTLAPGQSVLIRDGLIAAVGADITSASAPRRDGAGGYMIPGFWDSNVHTFSTSTEPDTALPLYLGNGVTGIRNMGALRPIEDQQTLQVRIEAGEVLGLRLILAGAWVDASSGSWPGMFLADTPDEAQAVVERIAAEGWAGLKAYSMLDEATCLALAEAAHDAGLPFVEHIPERVALGNAIDAGRDGMEHFGRVALARSTAEEGMLDEMRAAMAEAAEWARVFEIMAARNRIVLETWDGAVCETMRGRMVDAGIHASATLVVADFYTGNWHWADAPRMRMIPAEVHGPWGRPDCRLGAMTEEVRALAQDSIALDRRTFLMAHRAGIGQTRDISPVVTGIFLPVWRVRAYTLVDEINVWRDNTWSRPFFWEDLLRDDLNARLTQFELLVYFFVGRHDQTANPDLSRAYFDAIGAPVKGFNVFENSGHSSLFEETGRATETLLNDVLPGTP